jgi:membrane protease YdiL (CAAX protease family)
MRASLTAKKDLSLIYVLVFFGGLLLFVGLRQLTSPWKYLSLAGFLLSAVVIAAEVKTLQDLVRLFNLKKVSGNGYYYMVISLLLGLLWGISFRDYLGISQLPVRIALFAFTAMLTGGVEEVVFRGYIQLKLRNKGILWSAIIASAMHTFYKCFIFWTLPPVYYTNYLYFALWTFSMGCLLGGLKEYGRSTYVPVAGHALFDLVVYGDKMINTWWVWM